VELKAIVHEFPSKRWFWSGDSQLMKAKKMKDVQLTSFTFYVQILQFFASLTNSHHRSHIISDRPTKW